MQPRDRADSGGKDGMRNKVTAADAVKAADVLRKYCMQFQAKKTFCSGCIFYWKNAPMRYSFCRLDVNPVGYKLRSPKKHVMEGAE